ncbi:hypothetical protein [Denitrobaculum tricleocarpae]|uniref:Uncharacterized protein n=1 Tax=Denitrobaculum tricleocarpae TaxID=2591009 RepID=A0A545TT12_9PROT|nr:hypothetical protein [Denitrobaculum tricleocarpae]TQV80352.1 hypothetical protein FKG95_09155 [Denitrobaculum tricleocarpae]
MEHPNSIEGLDQRPETQNRRILRLTHHNLFGIAMDLRTRLGNMAADVVTQIDRIEERDAYMKLEEVLVFIEKGCDAASKAADISNEALDAQANREQTESLHTDLCQAIGSR